MKVLEFETKELLAREGFPVPRGRVASSALEAKEIAESLGCPVAVKAQIPTGRRMKAGGIRFAASPDEAGKAAEELLGKAILGFPVDRILVERKLDITAEVFLAATYDAAERTAVLIASKAGGIEVETSESVLRRAFSTQVVPPRTFGHEIASELGFQNEIMARLGDLINSLVQGFVRSDALLLEINPLALDSDGRWWVADAHFELDDDAAYRHPERTNQTAASIHTADRRSEFERKAAEIDSADHRGVAGRLVQFQGDLGLLIGGGGASLTIMDALLEAGLKPANYCEIGGNPSVWKIKELTKLILGQPQVKRLAVIMNVVSNTRVDLMARGVIKGVLEIGREPREVISAFRIPGSWEEDGQAILRHFGVPFFGRETSIDQVVEAIRCRS